METTTWVLIVSVVTVLFLYDYWQKSYFKHRGIPCDLPLPFIGHYHKLIRKGFIQVLFNTAKEKGKIFGLFIGNTPMVIISDADMLKEILIRKFSHFYNRRSIPFDDYPLNKALPCLEGERWKKVRNAITPAFSASKMKPISTLVNDSCDSLIKHLTSFVATNPDVEVKALYGSMTMDCIAKGGFGLQIDSQEDPNSPFVTHANSFFNLNLFSPVFILSIFLPQVAPIFNYFNIGIFPSKAKKFFMDVTQQAIQMRQDQGKKRVDMLQMMVNAHKTGEGSDATEEIPEIAGVEEQLGHHQKTELTDGEIMAQSLMFLLAGYETTNVALSFVSYSLALHPDLQERLFQEVQELAPDRDSVNYDTVNKMEYLDMFLNETMRLYPPGAVADRVCQEPVTVGDIHFEKGMQIFYNIIALHYDPDYWEEPEKFDPERFTKEATEKRHPFAYLPFGTGPRNCIGMRFAQMVLKMTIVRVVQNFKFEPCEQTAIPIKFGTRSVSPKKGITLRVISRE